MTITIRLPSGERRAITQDRILIGRGARCVICLPDAEHLQDEHARLRKIADRWFVESRGEWLIRVGDAPPARLGWLKTGDVIRLSQVGPDLVFEPAHEDVVLAGLESPDEEANWHSMPPPSPPAKGDSPRPTPPPLPDQRGHRPSPPPVPTGSVPARSAPAINPGHPGPPRPTPPPLPDQPAPDRPAPPPLPGERATRATPLTGDASPTRPQPPPTPTPRSATRSGPPPEGSEDRERVNPEANDDPPPDRRRSDREGSKPEAIGEVEPDEDDSEPGEDDDEPGDDPESPDRAWHTMAGTWVFGTLLLGFFGYVFILGPDKLPEFKQRMLGISCGLLAGLFAYFLSGEIKLRLPEMEGMIGEKSRATGGVGVFVLVLLWWSSPFAPVGLAEKVDSINDKIDNHTVALQRQGELMEAVAVSLGKPERIIANPASGRDHLSNATVYWSRQDYSEARKSYGRYLELEKSDFYDSYLTYWSLLEQELDHNEQDVQQAFGQMAERKPDSKAARLAMITKGHDRDAATKLRIFLKENADYLPAYRELYERLPRTTITEKEDAEWLRAEFQRRGGFQKALTYFRERDVPQLAMLKGFGREAETDPSRNLEVSYEFDQDIKLMFLEIKDGSLPRQITLTFPNGKEGTALFGPKNPLGEDEMAVAFALVTTGELHFEPRKSNDRRIFRHCGTIYGVNSKPVEVRVSYIDSKGHSYDFPRKIEVSIPSFQVEVVEGGDGLIVDREGPRLRITPLAFLKTCEISTNENGPFVDVPQHMNVPTMNEIPLKRIPGLSLTTGRRSVWIRGITFKESAKLGPELISFAVQ